MEVGSYSWQGEHCVQEESKRPAYGSTWLEARLKAGAAGWELRLRIVKGLNHAKKFILDSGANEEREGQE